MDESGDGSGQVPRRVRLAERWRQAGRVLARLSPEVYEAMLDVVEATAVRLPREDEKISESYFLT